MVIPELVPPFYNENMMMWPLSLILVDVSMMRVKNASSIPMCSPGQCTAHDGRLPPTIALCIIKFSNQVMTARILMELSVGLSSMIESGIMVLVLLSLYPDGIQSH